MLNRVLDNCQTQPGTAKFTAARFVNPVKTFKNPWQMLC